jgi:flagellar basal body-associated protein FliL
MYDFITQNKRATYMVVALLVMVFVTAGVMFTAPAWSQNQSEGSSKDRKAFEKETRTQSSSTQTDNRASTKKSVGTQATDDVTFTKTADPDTVEKNGLYLHSRVDQR